MTDHFLPSFRKLVFSGVSVIRLGGAKSWIVAAAFLLLISAVTYSVGQHGLAKYIGIIADALLILASAIYVIQISRRQETPDIQDEDNDR